MKLFAIRLLHFFRQEKILLSSLLLLAFLFRLPLLNGSFWLDEAAQALESQRPLSQQLQIQDDFQPPLMHLLTHFSISLGRLFGLQQSEWWLRSWGSLLPALLAIAASYLLAKRLLPKSRLAIFLALLLATSSFHIFFSQELRPYSLAAAFAAWSSLALLDILEKKSHAWWRFWLFSVLGLFSTYVYPFFLMSQYIYLIFRKSSWSKLLITALATGLAFAPWLPSFFGQLHAGQALRASMPGWDQVVSFTQWKALALVPLKFFFGVQDVEANFFFLTTAGILILLVAAQLGRRRQELLAAWRRPTQNSASVFLFATCFFLLPISLAWLLSFFVPVLQAKRVLFCLPFFFLALLSLFEEKGFAANLKNKLFFAFLLLINLLGTFHYWQDPQLQRENWRALLAEIRQHFAATNTVAVFAFNESFAPWQWYGGAGIETWSTGNYYFPDLADPAEATKVLANYDQVLLFDYLRDLTDPKNQLPSLVENLGFTPTGVIDYPHIGFVRMYSQSGKNLAGIMEKVE